VRNKCLSCPDFDYCSACYVNAKTSHAGHRFAALYEPLTYVPGSKEHHRGIFCDGPLCNNSGYIRGDRYKCAVCDDTDFCANCEALPSNPHNKTHPLIKIKVPIRHVEISTFNQVDDEHETVRLGDRRVAKHASTETVRTTSANAATQVQTVAEVCPADDSASSTTTLKAADSEKHVPGELQAWYESDSTPDGTRFAPNRFVSQSWTLRNPGPETWPAGCAVYFVGGDDMRNLDMLHPSSVSAIAKANQSTMLEEPLEPGKTAVFTVLVKSPVREGRCISYWRVKTPDGTPFGHKLWIDIMVHDTSVDLPIRTGPVGESKKATVTDEEDEEQKGSTMIFPKLEKESPVSSIHDVTESTVPQAPSVKSEEHDLLDDVESLELEEESDDGFLTDEEYDVLDASDEDFLEAQATIGGK
jgi:next to BRCA1 gene 1 protein